MSILGSLATARAIDTRCFWPPDKVMPLSPTRVSNPLGKSAMLLSKSASLAA